jgi:photosystem II stability/assembly factor-like uncharacterized protein
MTRLRGARPHVGVIAVIALLAGCTGAPIPSNGPSAVPQRSRATATSEPRATPELPTISHQPAELTSNSVDAELDTVGFAPDATHGWVGGAGLIVATADGGSTWMRQWTGDRTVVRVDVLDRLHVWALAGVAAPGGDLVVDTLLRTADGGRAWSSLPLSRQLTRLEITGASTAWAIERGIQAGGGTAPPRLVRSTDDGRTWKVAIPGVVSAVCFVTPLMGFAAGPRLLATIDGGRSWIGRAALPTEGAPMDLSCSAATVWVFVNLDGGAGGHVNYAAYRSTDGGRHLDQVLGNSFYDPPTGVGTASDEPGPFTAIGRSSAVELGISPAAEAASVTITQDGGRHWTTTVLEDVPTESVSLSFPNPTHGFVTENHWGRGSVLATDDAGRTWREVYPTTDPGPVTDISFVSAYTGFGVGLPGDASAIVETVDGARHWAVVGDLPEDAAVFGGGMATPTLSFWDESDGWAVSAAGGLFRTADGGRTWSRGAAPESLPLVGGVTFVDALNGCIVARNADSLTSVELHTEDGGTTWQARDDFLPLGACALGVNGVTLKTAAELAIGGSDLPQIITHGPDAWAVASGGIARTTDGGRSWLMFDWSPSFGDISPTSLTFGDSSNGWFLTELGPIYATHDGGRTWAIVP